LEDVAHALTLGKASYRTLTANVVIAVMFNIAGMLLAGLGLVTPLIAVGWMIVSVFAILLSTLRVRALRLEHGAATETGSLAEIELAVPRMVCEGCAETIAAALNGVPGVRGVTARVEQKRVLVRYDPGVVQAGHLKGALRAVGFDAVEV